MSNGSHFYHLIFNMCSSNFYRLSSKSNCVHKILYPAHRSVTTTNIEYKIKGTWSVLKKIILWMITIHYPNKTRSHLFTFVPMAPFTPKSTSKLRSALSALHFRYSIVIPRFIVHFPRQYGSILITIITMVFITPLTTTTLLIVTNYCAQCLLVLTLYVNEYLWQYCNYENKRPI